LCLTSTGKDKLDKALQAAEQAKNPAIEDIKDLLFQCANSQQHDETGAIVYYWEWIKWYPAYEDVGFVESFIRSLNREDYYFIRVGESADDTEQKGNFWDNPFNMCLLREIGFDSEPATTAA
jgi:hypothetical protein